MNMTQEEINSDQVKNDIEEMAWELNEANKHLQIVMRKLKEIYQGVQNV